VSLNSVDHLSPSLITLLRCPRSLHTKPLSPVRLHEPTKTITATELPLNKNDCKRTRGEHSSIYPVLPNAC